MEEKRCCPIKNGYIYKDAETCKIKRKILYEAGNIKIKRRERRKELWRQTK